VFTNGCFDILHRGHVELLQYCATLGQEVIVGINSDSSVRRLKGSERPINDQATRKFLLESIRFVSKVYVFDEDTPYRLIQEIMPKVVVKGGDYLPENVVGSDIAEIRIFPLINGESTTSILQRIRSL
jgi:rfaE bifunctional protein nucleotidyltransferase chain/domain